MAEPSTVEVEREALALFETLLDVPEAERDAWIEAHSEGKPKLRRRLTAMLRADTLAGQNAGLKTGAAVDTVAPEPDPESIGAYRITGLIGRGGMGAVYRGERMTGDFAHVVAIKIIKTGLLSESLIERFQRERQILATLSHPNIAQLYDGGETAASDTGKGAPYIVMEWVDGLPLMAYVTAHGLGLPARLELFTAMCRAVACAHRSLIVHRDLTPSNVLVTRDGIVKLIDFGIAKPADSKADGGHSKVTATLSLTPGFAAPERLTSNEVTTAADVYSLGRLLARLAGDDLPEPSPELKAIIARATAEKPADRYVSADALRADVEAFASGRPVAAMNGGRGYVFAKFVRRHRLSVTGASAAAIALILAFGLVLSANHRERLARAVAEKRFEETRTIAKTLLFEVYDEVSKVPGATKARALLAKTGTQYLDTLANDRTAPAAVRIEAGQGFVRLAQVTGGGESGQLGRYEDANALLARGETILKEVHAQNPDNADAGKAYADLLLEQSGTNLYNNNDADTARAQAIKVQALLKDIAASDAGLASTMMLAIQAEGDSWGWNDEYAPARTAHLKAETFYNGLSPALQADSKVMMARSSNLRLLGESHHKLKQAAEAKAALATAVTINRELVRREPGNAKMTRKLITSLWYSAVVHRTNMRDAEAKAAISEAYALAQQWHKRDPDDSGALQMVAITGEVYAQVLVDHRQYAAAERTSDEVMAAHRTMVARAGNTPGALRSMTSAMATRGGNFYNSGNYKKACEAWQQTRDNYDLLDRRGQLSKLDRNNGYATIKDYLARACAPPHAGLGKSV